MSLRRVACLAVVLALAAGAAACSDDDDGAEPRASSTSVSSTTTAAGGGGLVRVEVEGRPSAALATDLGAGRLLIASDDEEDGRSRVRAYAPDAGAVGGEAIVGPAPIALVAAGDGVWAVGATGVLTKISAPRPEVLVMIELGGSLVDAAVVGERMFVADIERSVVHVLDAETGEVVEDPVPVPTGAVRLTAAADRVWVSGLEDQVTPIDTQALVARQPVRVGRGPIGMAVVRDVLWVANSDDDTVSRISLESGQPVGEPLAVGDAPIAVAVDGADVWVLNQDAPSLVRFDAETGQPIGAPVALPMRPRGMTVTEAGVWVVGVDPSLAVLHASQSGSSAGG